LKFFFRPAVFLTVVFCFADESGISDPEGMLNQGEILELQIETSQANPVVNNPWSVYVLVNHPNPQEVNAVPPFIPSSLALERVRIDARTMAQGERWTRVEFLFIPLRAEVINLPPFEIQTPNARAFTDQISVRFRELAARYEPRFRWLGAIPAAYPGEKAELFLELTNWDPGKKTPQGLFRGKAPLNAIIEEKAPQTADNGLYHYTIGVTPLEGNGVTLEAFSFQSDGYALSIPGIFIPVLSGRPKVSSGSAADPGSDSVESVTGIIPQDSVPPPPFPGTREKLFFLFQGEYDRIVAGAEVLWNENRKAEALAMLRRSERDSFSGPFFGSLRRELEQVLELGFTENESWRPVKTPLVLCAILSVAVISALVSFLVLRPRQKIHAELLGLIFRQRNSIIGVVILIVVIGAALMFLEEKLMNFSVSRSGNAAVLKTTQIYRVPDLGGAVNGRFSEGQPVIVSSFSNEWCLAETPDGRSGWVKRESVITY
jgi:hypothetical protein